jgi:hypothetical protein
MILEFVLEDPRDFFADYLKNRSNERMILLHGSSGRAAGFRGRISNSVGVDSCCDSPFRLVNGCLIGQIDRCTYLCVMEVLCEVRICIHSSRRKDQ